jgi:hypothetical protein
VLERASALGFVEELALWSGLFFPMSGPRSSFSASGRVVVNVRIVGATRRERTVGRRRSDIVM